MKKLPMNLPNRITMVRILLIPIHLVLLALGGDILPYVAAAVFAIAAISDFLDGRIARQRNLVTDFGKFMDPIADKLLVLLPYILLAARHSSPLNILAVLLMVAREVIVSGFRLVAVTRSIVIPADWSGKIKTAVQMVSVFLLTLGISLGWYLAWAAAILSVWSGAGLLLRNRRVLEEAA